MMYLPEQQSSRKGASPELEKEQKLKRWMKKEANEIEKTVLSKKINTYGQRILTKSIDKEY